jgi:hypothetical protein
MGRPPRLVKLLLDRFRCEVGSRQVVGQPSTIRVQDVADFVDTSLFSPGRLLPLVVFTPLAENNQQLVDPSRISRLLGTLAEVAVIDTTSTSRALTECVGYEFSAFNGAARLYLPKLDPEKSDPYDHPLFLPRTVTEPGFDWLLYNTVVRLAERRVAAGGTEWRTARDQCLQARDALLREAASRADVAEIAEALLAQHEATIRQLEVEKADLRERLERAEDLNASLSDTVRQLSQDWNDQRSTSTVPATITSVEDAVLVAADRFSHLTFLAEAYESAAESNYIHHQKVFEVFGALENIALNRRADGALGGDPATLIGAYGFEYASHQSDSTMARYGSSYVFQHSGQDVTLEGHVKLGNSRDPQYTLRIHCGWDSAAESWIIGWVGRHLHVKST